MTICIVSAMYDHTTGGVERYTKGLAATLAGMGHTVLVVTSDSCCPEWSGQARTEDGITVFYASSTGLIAGRLPFLTGKGRKEFRAYLADKAVDRMLIQTCLYSLSIAAAQYAAEQGIPFVTMVHGSDYIVGGGAVGFAEHRYEDLLRRRMDRYCSHWFGVGIASIRWMSTLGIAMEGELPNFVIQREIEEAGQTELPAAYRSIVFPENGMKIVYCGRLIREKGVLKLIDAFRKLREERSDVSLVIIGEGPEAENVAAIAAEDSAIHYLGRQEHSAVLRVLTDADVFCFPSDYSEGLPTVLLEAAACGCYPITSNKGSIAEFIPSPEYGTVLSDTETGTILAALKGALAPGAGEIARNAQKRTLARFSSAYTAEELIRVFDHIGE